MKELCNEFVFWDERGVIFEVKAAKGKLLEISIGADGKGSMKEVSVVDDTNLELPSISAGEYAEVLSMYTDKDGNKAVVPQGWTVSGVASENVIWGKDIGLVIYYIPKEKVSGIDWKNKSKVNGLMKTYDQLVWIPINMLSDTSTLDGIHFNEKFGRMNYRNEEFSESEYNEPLVGELLGTKKSIDTYGGCYITRYKVSKDKKTGEPRSIKGAYPWAEIDFQTAKNVAATMSKSENLISHLTYGAEYDTRIKWTIETGTVTRRDIAEDSTRLGNYHNNKEYPNKIVKTGEDGCINMIYGLTGNMDEWTQESKNSHRVIRGGFYYNAGFDFPAACRNQLDPKDCYYVTGFRATFILKVAI